MKLYPECMTCFMDQVNRAFRLLKPDLSEDIIVEAQHELMSEISKTDIQRIPNVMLGTMTYGLIARKLSVKDPYYELKKKYNAIALDLYPRVKKMIAERKFAMQKKENKSKTVVLTQTEEALLLAVRASILGNAIDFGSPFPIDVAKELETIESDDLGGESNIYNFVKSLKQAVNILILGDNAGEIVFDKLFIEELHELYPEKKITYSVRGGPIINDATMEDALAIGLNKICKIVVTSATPGIYLKHSTPEFIRSFESADLILSKGQGNFETLIDIPTPKAEVYFLLKAKCTLMEKIFHVKLGTLLLVKKEKDMVQRIGNKFLAGNC
jgi:uncharacterized protein with ATP-grasp and redox domains